MVAARIAGSIVLALSLSGAKNHQQRTYDHGKDFEFSSHLTVAKLPNLWIAYIVLLWRRRDRKSLVGTSSFLIWGS